jgi:hypothetical protein
VDVVVARMRSFDPAGVAMAVASGDAAVEADGAAGLDEPPVQPARAAATITAPIIGRARREAPAWVVILSLSTRD